MTPREAERGMPPPASNAGVAWIGAWLVLAVFVVAVGAASPLNYEAFRSIGALIVVYLLLTNWQKAAGAIDTFDRWLWAGVAPAGGPIR